MESAVKSESYSDGFALFDSANAQARSEQARTGIAVRTAMTQLVFDRFLCRVFAEPDSGFGLKGGTGMLARIPQGRATEDVDLEHGSHTLAAAIDEITRLAAVDLGDFHRFVRGRQRPMVGGTQPGVDGARLTFHAELLGPITTVGQPRIRRLNPVSVDLAIHGRPSAPLVRRAPGFRLDLRKPLVVHDYVMISVEDQIADKASAMMGTSYASGEGSSRAKDLVDIVLLAHHEPMGSDTLRAAIIAERTRRGIPHFDTLTATAAIRGGFPTTAANTVALPAGLTWEGALAIANSLIGPALTGTASGRTWDPAAQLWQ